MIYGLHGAAVNDICDRQCSGRGNVLDEMVAIVESAAIEWTLHKFDGNKSKAAELLGITRKTLLSKIRKYNINQEKVK